MTHRDHVVIVGAGIGGLSAAVLLAARGLAVTVLERGPSVGGKMRQVDVGGKLLDAGPTVLTMRDVFEEIFADAGDSLTSHLNLQPVDILARHAWSDHERLDLFADLERSASAIKDFAGPVDARGFLEFSRQAKRVFEALNTAFIRAPRPGPLSLSYRLGYGGLHDLWRTSPFDTLWKNLGTYFQDPRLRQLFGRYSTYVGSSPFLSPATLMLIAHVEQAGVWLVEGGVYRLALALHDLAIKHGAVFRFNAEVCGLLTEGGRATGVSLPSGEQIEARGVVVNADSAAVAAGLLGRTAADAVAPQPIRHRSLSAVTWLMQAQTAGFPLSRHNVFFSGNYPAEFDDIFRSHRLPRAPTVYVCAQDRDDQGNRMDDGPERIMCLVNAPALGDQTSQTELDLERCQADTFEHLARCGLHLQFVGEPLLTTGPVQFESLFPGTGGSLYGQASHGWRASFRRPGSRTGIPGLHLAGGSVHPGAGIPMAAMSGRLAVNSLLTDLASRPRSRQMAIAGGMSTP